MTRSRQIKARGRIRLCLKQSLSDGDKTAAGLISSFRSSKQKECIHQQTPCWTKNTIKGGFVEPADKNVNLAVEANQASSAAYQQEA